VRQGDDAGLAVEVDRPTTWLALVTINTFAAVTAGVLPAIVAILVDHEHLAPIDAGHISSLYSVGGVLAGLSGLLWVRRFDRRVMLAVVIVLGLCADLSAVVLQGYALIGAGRFVAGFAGSSAIIIVNSTIALSRHSERLFGLVLTSQSLLAAALFFALPRLAWEAAGLFSMLAAFWVVILPLAFLVPGFPESATSRGTAGERSEGRALLRSSVGLLVLAFLSFYVATGALWTFVYLIGEWHGISSTAVGSAMSLAMLAAIVGGSTVTALGKRYGRSRPLIAALVANVAFTAILLTPTGVGVYTLAVCATNLLFTFSLALFLTLLGDEDPQGRLLSVANMVIFGGLALGPWLFGPSTEGGSYRALLVGTVVLFAVSPALLCLRSLPRGRSGDSVAPLPEPTTGLTPPSAGSGGGGRRRPRRSRCRRRAR